jgi:hypothetical protein
MDPEGRIRRACYRAGRNLTWDEWRLYFPDKEYRKTCAEGPEGE